MGKESTVFIGNLDPRVDERLIYELMVQAGPLVDVNIPRDKDKENRHRGFGFAEFQDPETARYAIELFSNNVSLFNRKLRFNMSERKAPGGASFPPAPTSLHQGDFPPQYPE